MNERIRELAKQAGMLDFSQVSGGRYKVTEVDIEEFAQLVVRECAGVVDNAVTHRESASTYVNKIKEHFGVEE